MSRIFFILLLAAAWIDGHAQSSLPPCPTDTSVVWTNCFGTYIWPDGAKYVGEYKDGKRNGQGTMTSRSGMKYIGEYKQDEPNGQGAFISAKGYPIAFGDWLNEETVVTPGGRWFWAGNSDYTSVFVLTESIRQDGMFRRVWVINAFSERNLEGGFLSTRGLEKFDCADERIQLVTQTNFSGAFATGDVLASLDEGEWTFVPPGTAYSAVVKYVCDYKLAPSK